MKILLVKCVHIVQEQTPTGKVPALFNDASKAFQPFQYGYVQQHVSNLGFTMKVTFWWNVLADTLGEYWFISSNESPALG